MCVCVCVCVLVAKLCPIPCNPMDYSIRATREIMKAKLVRGRAGVFMRKSINIIGEDEVVYVERFQDIGEGRAGGKQVREVVLRLGYALEFSGDL